jgi:lysophospholipase L1-like esterase
MIMQQEPYVKELARILLAGSSHTRLFYPYVKSFLRGKAFVRTLPYDAGRTDEILNSLSDWPLEGQDIMYLYSGHRDLMLNESGTVFINPGLFEDNLLRIIKEIRKRTTAIIVLSNIPEVSPGFLAGDEGRNKRIGNYNRIIRSIAKEQGARLHDFQGYVSAHGNSEKIYTDGLHFTREFYRRFAEHLASFLMACIKDRL